MKYVKVKISHYKDEKWIGEHKNSHSFAFSSKFIGYDNKFVCFFIQHFLVNKRITRKGKKDKIGEETYQFLEEVELDDFQQK